MTYDKPITIQTQDPITELWTDALHLHARVNRNSVGVTMAAGADQYHVRLDFDLRYTAQLAAIAFSVQPYRIVYRGRHFKVVDYDDYMERHLTTRLVGEMYE